MKFLKGQGLLNDQEWKRIRVMLMYFWHYVYEPLKNFYEIQVKLIDLLKDEFGFDVQWLGLRKDHAYISLRDPIIRCLDIMLKNEQKCELYVVVSREKAKKLKRKPYATLFEKTENLGPLNLPYKVHKRASRGRRPHFLILSINKEEFEELETVKAKLQRVFTDLNKV